MRAETFYKGEGIELAKAFWKGSYGYEINPRMLSPIGILVSDNSTPLAVCFIYTTCTEMAWIGFTVRNPEISAFQAGVAIDLLIAAAEEEIRGLGYSIVYTAFGSKTLQKLVSRRGYLSGDQAQAFFKEL